MSACRAWPIQLDDPWIEVIERHAPEGIIPLHLADTPPKAPHIFLGQKAMRGEHAVTEEANPLANWKDYVLGCVQAQTQCRQEFCHCSRTAANSLLSSAKTRKSLT